MNLLSSKNTNITFGLLTDFGLDFAVASIKATLFRALPDCSIIDIDHSIEKFCIASGAFVLEKVYAYFPENSYIIAVVDPGVGTERNGIVVRLGSYTFIGPNNGLFHYILKQKGATVFKINEACFPEKSNTFHGRDIFTPIAIQLAQHNNDALLPIEKKDINYCALLETQKIVTYIDSFGNIKTNIPVDTQWVDRLLQLKIDEKSLEVPFVTTFDNVKPGQVLCYKGSNETLEIAINQGSARDYLQVFPGKQIVVTV